MWALHGLQLPSEHIHQLQCGVFHGLQVDMCSTVDLHGLQGDHLHHHGCLSGAAGESLLWHLEHVVPSFFTDLGVCRVVSPILTPLSHNCCAAFFPLLKYVITVAPPWAQLWPAVGLSWSWLELPLLDMRTAPGLVTEATHAVPSPPPNLATQTQDTMTDVC